MQEISLNLVDSSYSYLIHSLLFYYKPFVVRLFILSQEMM